MTERAPRDIGDKVVIGDVGGGNEKPYPLAEMPNNYSYERVSDHPEVQPNQPLAIPLSFHGGMGDSVYTPESASYLQNTGLLVDQPNIIRAAPDDTTVTLTDAAKPPQYFFETLAPNATIAHDASDNATASSTTVTISDFTVASGNNRILIVGVSSNKVLSSDTVTFDGVSLTILASHRPGNSATEPIVAVYYLLNPSVSTGDIVFTASPSSDLIIGATSRTDINLLDPFGTVAKATGTDTAPTVNAVSASGEIVMDVMAATNPSSCSADANGSRTERWNTNVSSSTRGASSEKDGAGSVTMDWTLGSSVEWTIMAFALKPAKTPVLYAITPEPNEVKVYKISLSAGDFGTLLNTKTFSVTTTQPMGRPAEWNDGSNTLWRLGLGDNGKIQKLAAIASGTSNDTWTASADADARHLKVVGNRLIRSTDENQISILPRGSDPMTEANWGGDFFAGDVSSNVTELGEASGLGYIGKEDGFYEWDLVGEAQNVFPEIGNAERNGQGMIYYHGGFLIPAGQLWWTRTGKPVGPDSNPSNQGSDGTLKLTNYSKFGRWHGSATIGSIFYGLYFSPGSSDKCILFQGREREDIQGWGPMVFHSLRQPTGDSEDFHGVSITETSQFSAAETRPCLWYADGNDLSYIWLNQDGTPFSEPGSMDVTGAVIISAPINFGLSEEIVKQLRVIECVSENLNAAAPTTGSFQFAVRRNGGISWEDVGGTIFDSSPTTQQRFWTQDSNDTAEWMLVRCTYVSGSTPTDTDVPTLRNVIIRALAKPDTTPVWTFLIVGRDKGKTSKKVRSELEGYVGVLKNWEMPDGDSFNGVLTNLRLLRADELRDLTERNQKPPSFVFEAKVREMAGS